MATTMNVVKLQSLLDKEPKMKYVLEFLAARQRGRSDTDINRVSRLLRDRGVHVTFDEVMGCFKHIEELGFGKIVRNRFIWAYNLVSVGQAGLGKSDGSVEEQKRRLPKAEIPAPKTTSAIPTVTAPTMQMSKLIIRRGEYEIEVPNQINDRDINLLANILNRLDNG